MRMKRIIAILAIAMGSAGFAASAQEATDSVSNASSDASGAASGIITIAPLFDYPSAPDDVQGLDGKSEWLLQHFWDQMDFKQKTVDQNALNHAFSVYIVPMRFASKQATDKSVEAILKAVKKNPGLQYQFTRAAEENLYGSRAEVWIDDVYMKFIESAIANKKIDKSRKLRWQSQLKQLKACHTGDPMPNFKLLAKSGQEGVFAPGNHVTIIEFGDPDCDDCRIARLKMESNVALQSKVRSGDAAIYFLVTDPESSWILDTIGYPSSWTVAAAPNADDELDLRRTPCFYVLDKEGKIAGKNLDAESAIRLAETLLQ